MRRERPIQLLAMAVLMPLFLGTVLPQQLRTLVCRYTGITMPEEVCCPQQSAQDAQAPARLRNESCCVVKNLRLVKLVSVQRPEASQPGQPQLLERLVFAEADIVANHRLRPPDASAPAHGPPIVLAKHAFLI